MLGKSTSYSTETQPIGSCFGIGQVFLQLLSGSLQFLYFGQNNQKQKNQLYYLCLNMTADFRNFVAKTDEKQKPKDEMNRTYVIYFTRGNFFGNLFYPFELK